MYVHPAAGWSVRGFGRDDRNSCIAIFRDCLAEFPWRGEWRSHLPALDKALARPPTFVAEEPNAGVIGFLTLDRPNAYVDHLFVAFDWRLCGVGRGLLEVARNRVGRPLSLHVDAQNRAALAAYEALGWKVAARASTGPAGRQYRLVSP